MDDYKVIYVPLRDPIDYYSIPQPGDRPLKGDIKVIGYRKVFGWSESKFMDFIHFVYGAAPEIVEEFFSRCGPDGTDMEIFEFFLAAAGFSFWHIGEFSGFYKEMCRNDTRLPELRQKDNLLPFAAGYILFNWTLNPEVPKDFSARRQLVKQNLANNHSSGGE